MYRNEKKNWKTFFYTVAYLTKTGVHGALKLPSLKISLA